MTRENDSVGEAGWAALPVPQRPWLCCRLNHRWQVDLHTRGWIGYLNLL